MWIRFILPSAVMLALAIILTVPFAYAEPFEPVQIGKNYNKQYIGSLPDGRPIWQFSTYPDRILSGGQYKDYILFEDVNTVRLETANSGSLIFNKNTCSYNFHNGGYIDELNTPKIKNISWAVKGKEASSSTWSNVNGINNAACSVSVQTTEHTVKITGTKSNTSGTFQIVLDYLPGGGIKETMRAFNNNPAWNNHHIGFTETFEVPRIVHFGKHVYDLANYNGTTLGRNWIDNNNAKLVRLADTVYYDFGIGFDQLDNIKISWDGTTAKLSLNYLFTNQTVPYQTWFEVDPTFGYKVVNDDQSYGTTAGAATTCSSTYNNLDPVLRLYNPASAVGDQCILPLFNFDVSSLPTKSITISSATLEYGVSGTSGGGQNCKWRAIPNNSTGQGVITGLLSTGRILATGDTGCTSAGAGKTVTLNAANMTTYVTGQTGDILYIGAEKDGTRGGAATVTTFNSGTARLQFNYTVSAPNSPTNFVAESQARKVMYNWTQTSGTGITGYYIGRSLDNATWPQVNKTLTANVTSYLDSAYYRIGLLYYVNITATNGGLANSTSKYTSFTMDDYPSAPLSLYRTLVNSTAVKLNWSPPSSSGGDIVTGYRVERATGFTCTGFSTLTNHTTALNYNNTGLSTTQQYCYRVAAWNGAGMGAYSNNVLRFSLANAVDDLNIINVGTNSVDLEWTQPSLGDGTLSGYMVNFTSPHGTPTTMITNNTLSAITTYTINGLTDGTDYSFRIGIWTTAGLNASGNTADTTTFALANFTIGTFNLNTTNPEVTPIRFVRTDISDTQTQVKVIYPNSANMTCVLDYQFAQQSDTYSNLVGAQYSANFKANDFLMTDSNNDIIAFDCTDVETNNTATYVLQQSDFALKEQIENFRNGTYGTMGMIGYIDLVTLVIFIFVMIGFNRINPSVGAIMSIAMLGAIAYFEIISIPGAIFGAIAVVVMLIIGSTRKDD